MEVKYKTIVLNNETGALRDANIEIYKILEDDYTHAPKDMLLLKFTNEHYSGEWAPIEYIVKGMLIPAITEYERKNKKEVRVIWAYYKNTRA